MGTDNRRYQASLFPQLPILSQQAMIGILERYYPLLWRVVMEPWQEFQDYRTRDHNFVRMNEDEAGWWLSMQAAKQAQAVFDGVSGVRLVERHNKLVIVFDDRLAVAIKKLTRRRAKSGHFRLTRSNYLTPANRDFWDQRANEGDLNLPRVILGYELCKEMTEIRLLVAYPRTRGKGVEWAVRVPEPAVSRPVIFIPAASSEVVPTVEEKGYTIGDRPQADTGDQGKKGDAG